MGNSLLDRLVERHRRARVANPRILEIGASSGEHLRYVDRSSQEDSFYVGLDLRPGVTDPQLLLDVTKSSLAAFVAGDAS